MHKAVPAKSTSSRTTPFQTAHIIEFGLKVTQRNRNTQKVFAVCCQFCAYFGREEVIGQKRDRKQTQNPRDWTSFRPQ